MNQHGTLKELGGRRCSVIRVISNLWTAVSRVPGELPFISRAPVNHGATSRSASEQITKRGCDMHVETKIYDRSMNFHFPVLVVPPIHHPAQPQQNQIEVTSYLKMYFASSAHDQLYIWAHNHHNRNGAPHCPAPCILVWPTPVPPYCDLL